MKLYTMFSQELSGDAPPEEPAMLIAWILKAQSKIFMMAKEPQSGGVFYQGAMLTIKDQSSLVRISPFELRQYATMLYSTISGRGTVIEAVPASDGMLVTYILKVQQMYLGAPAATT